MKYSIEDIDDALLATYPDSFAAMLRSTTRPQILRMAAADLFAELIPYGQVSYQQQGVIASALRDLARTGHFIPF